MKSGVLDKNNVEICDGDTVLYTAGNRYTKEISATYFKVKFEYGGFYLLDLDQETIIGAQQSTVSNLSLSQIALYGDLCAPTKKLGCMEIVK